MEIEHTLFVGCAPLRSIFTIVYLQERSLRDRVIRMTLISLMFTSRQLDTRNFVYFKEIHC